MSIYRGSQCIAGVYTLLDKANTDLSNLTTTGRKAFLNKQQITNCILEDPQKIILSLNNGTLTLKAGSVVCVPNGFESDGTTPKFDEVTIASDLSITCSGARTAMLVSNTTGTLLHLYNMEDCSSGATWSGGTHSLFYNTSINYCSRTADGGSTWENTSFPIAVFTSGDTQITSIDQTFQSIGYIGSTVFVRKGLKVLIPNGRNADGSLKNIEVTTDKVAIKTENTGGTFYQEIAIYPGGSLDNPTNNVYNPDTNYNSYTWAIIGKMTRTNGVISNFQPYTATNILKYSDKSQISGLGMPSGRYIDLTLGASGSTYTAPANGWLYLGKANSYAGGIIDMYNTTSKYRLQTTTSTSNGYMLLTIPCRKNDVINITYVADGTLVGFRFIYAEGEAS